MQYRARLSSVVRFAAAVLPEHALLGAGRRLEAAVAACAPGSGAPGGKSVFPECTRVLQRGLVGFCEAAARLAWKAYKSTSHFVLFLSPPRCPSGTKPEDARALLESAVHFMESSFKAVWDGSIEQQPAKLQGALRGRGQCMCSGWDRWGSALKEA